MVAVMVFISESSFSANRYWIGPSGGNWNAAANWSNRSGGASISAIPGASDMVFFEGAANCTVDANLNVKGISIDATYSGTISVNSGVLITIASSGFTQAGGTFTGGNQEIRINGPFSLSGGIFNSTSGTLQVSSNFSFTAGAFNHNNGTVTFSAAQTITGNAVFYDILFVSSGGIYTIASGTTIKSTHNVTISGGASCTFNTGTLELTGNLTLTSTSNNSVNGGSATFVFNGTGIQTIQSAIREISVGTNERMCALPNIEINKVSGSLHLIGLISLNGTSWRTTAGAALIDAGTSTVNIYSNITFTGEDLSLYNIHIWPNSSSITLSPASYVLTATNNVTINGGGYYSLNTGTLAIKGNLLLMSTSTSAINGGTGTILFDGTGAQYINSSTSDLNYVCALPSIAINKTSGSLNFAGTINVAGTSWNTIAGASLVNFGTSVINVLRSCTVSGQDLSMYDLVITGTFNTITISSGVTWVCNHRLTLAGGASWYQINTGTINAKGDILVTNTNTSNSVGGTATILVDGTADQTLTGSGIEGGGKLPAIQINKTGGTLFLSGIISTGNNWTYTAGNVDAAAYNSTLDFYKTAVIDGQGTSNTMSFFNVLFSGFISLGGNMDVNGNFAIRTGVNNRLDVNATPSYQLNVAGNWTNANSVTASSFNQQTGKVVFDGGSAQQLTLASTAHTEFFYNLEISNSNGGLLLNAPVTVSGNLHLISGKIFSSVTNLLSLSNAATATGASDSGFVSGPVLKTGNQAFTFPVGKNNSYAPVSISAPGVNTDQFTAEYFQADPHASYSTASKEPSLDHISRCESWTLNRTTGASSVSVRLSWDTRSCGITNTGDIRVAHWNGGQWTNSGNGGTTGTISAGSVVSSGARSSFGVFTLSSAAPTNPLPVELLSFTGECTGTAIQLHWKTVSEHNNHYFTIEHSADGKRWEMLEKITAKNLITGAGYSSTDEKNRYGSIHYYRLKQTDFDGTSRCFNILKVESCAIIAEEAEIYPNPSAGVFRIQLTGVADSAVPIVIYNSSGKEMMKGHADEEFNLGEMPAGIYFCYLNLPSGSIVKKIIRE